MKKNNVIDFISYRREAIAKSEPKKIETELSDAIEELIQRLRNSNPLITKTYSNQG